MTSCYREARVEDAPMLVAIFRESFCDTFGHLYSAEDLQAFLAEHTVEHWAKQLRDTAFAVRIAEDESGGLGFVKLGPLRLPVEPRGHAIELRQFYMLNRGQGSGAASALMDWVLEEARVRGALELYLSVYTDNPRARRFYARYGFEEVGPYAFMVGNQADEDIIMKLAL